VSITLPVYVLAIGFAALLTPTLVMVYLWDRQKTRYIKHQTVLREFLVKAKSDRNDKARIPAGIITHMFELDVDVVPTFDARPGKQHRHPALRRTR
jgi:hypothetical protein